MIGIVAAAKPQTMAGRNFVVKSIVKNFVRSVPSSWLYKPAGILKAHFQLRRMHVHVDRLRRHVDPQKRNRIAAGQQQSAIGFAQGMLQAPDRGWPGR